MDATAWTIVAMAVVLAVWMVRNFNSWYYEPRLRAGTAPLPPGDMGWPIFGHMMDFISAFKSNDPDAFTNSYVKKYGRIGLYKTHLFGQATILATTPETNKAVLMGDQHHFISGWPTSTKAVMGSRSFLCIEGDEHKQMRKLTSASVNGTKTLGSYVPKIDIQAKREVARWAEEGQVNLFLKCKKFTFEMIANIMIGYEGGHNTEAFSNEFLGIVAGIRSFPLNIPGMAYHNSLQSRKRLVQRFLDIIGERRRTGKKEVDVLQILMDSTDEDTGAKLTDMECIDTVLVYLVAGHESSAHTVLWYMILLSQHPHVLHKVREELQGIEDARKPGAPLDYSDYRKMHYLNNVLDEILRLVNLAPMVFRKVQETSVVNGFTIPKGWSVESWFRTVHLDPEVYPDPLTFNPDRWKGLKVKPGMFIPFGAGYRLCPGRDFAKMQISIIAYNLTLFYDWTPLNLKYKTMYLPHPRPIDGFPVRITPRAGVKQPAIH